MKGGDLENECEIIINKSQALFNSEFLIKLYETRISIISMIAKRNILQEMGRRNNV